MASSGLDVRETHIFYGTNFALWKNHMLDHFRAKGPKFWWVVTSGLTKAQRVLYEFDAHACCFLMDDLSFDLMKQVNIKGTAR